MNPQRALNGDSGSSCKELCLLSDTAHYTCRKKGLVSVCIPSKTDPETRAREQVVNLGGGDLRKHKLVTWKQETGKGENPTECELMSRLSLWDLGSISLESPCDPATRIA